jgi:hypothetical protein
MRFAQRRNRLKTHFSERITVVKRRISVITVRNHYVTYLFNKDFQTNFFIIRATIRDVSNTCLDLISDAAFSNGPAELWQEQWKYIESLISQDRWGGRRGGRIGKEQKKTALKSRHATTDRMDNHDLDDQSKDGKILDLNNNASQSTWRWW